MDLSHGFLSHIKSEERRMTAFYFLPLAWFVRVCNMSWIQSHFFLDLFVQHVKTNGAYFHRGDT